MIEEQFVGYETAKLLKKAGYNSPCKCIYDISPEGGYKRYQNIIGYYDVEKDDIYQSRAYILAPTQAVAARWLREVHNLHVYAIQTNLPLTEPQTTKWEWGYIVTKVDDPNTLDKLFDMCYGSY